MLEPIKHSLEFKRIVLASVSARRSEILRSVGLRFEIMPSLFPENLDPKNYPNLAEYAVETAYRKVLDVADRMKEDLNQPDIIIGADTVVTLDGKVYGKPKDSKTAQQYLEDLSGRQHVVHTGVVIKTPTATVKFHETAQVTMAFLTDEIISGYVRTREPLDKAGGYGIQGIGGSLIEKINGDYYTVLGLPLHSFCKHLLWIFDDRKKKMELEMSLGLQCYQEYPVVDQDCKE
ncbi:N-acetylserotonin O-methyltransferase-like protein isoform X2 [Cimex lectularius]|uniref:Uncharacterized protein n=1 Tax=Cimex lectularius TaxID=79782 RepID=A0A8I6RUI2_CIMLE|nr:N-acetylserotonin O-methyltransferase-like protein isoform X2 [Cimex lectularius]